MQHRARAVRLWTLNALAWTTLALGGVALRALDAMTAGQRITTGVLLRDVPLLALWALATPGIITTVRRFPIRGAHAVRNVLVHFVIGTSFVVVTNVLIRLPLLSAGTAALATSTLRGLAVYFPGAIALYAVIVAIGQRMHAASADATIVGQTRAVGEAESAEVVDEAGEPRLVIREWNRVHFISLDEIHWIEANNNHVVVHTDAREYKGRERMSDVEARLDPRRFVRVHRSAIVHLPKIREVQPLMHGDQAIVLHSGAIVRVARSRRHALETALGTPL